MTLKPLADNVVLKGVEEEKSEGGLILSTSNKEKPVVSAVVAVGPGTKDEPMTLSVGQKVIVGKFAGNEVKLDGETYSIVKLSEILAVVE